MTKQDLYFVTSNSKKFDSLSKMLSPIGINLIRLEYDFDEGRELSIETVTKSKLNQAKQAFPGKKIIVDDRGFFIPVLNGFPGPFVKILLNSFSYKGLIKLMADEKDRRAIFSFAVGYYDGKEDRVFTADEVGFIIQEPRGDNLHGWTELLYVYGHPSYPNKSLAELTDTEWTNYLKQIEDVDPFALLKNHLQSRMELKD
jgi:non-canonical purine NTP pyrophosphatase (RdgB/HAM1 family)